MPDIDHDALKRAARAATQGEWRAGGVRGTIVGALDQNGAWRDAVAQVETGPQDAAYIVAAQPSVILALLEERKRLVARATAVEAERDRLREALAAANQLCRSAFSIAERHGDDTNWWAFTANLKVELLRQHAILWPNTAFVEKEPTMSGAMAKVPDDDTLMIAWVEYTATAEYANSRRWAMQPPHTDGAMWAAFEAGYRAAKKEQSHEGA